MSSSSNNSNSAKRHKPNDAQQKLVGDTDVPPLTRLCTRWAENHGSFVCAIPDSNDVLVAWFAGSSEGSEDCKLRLTRISGDSVSAEETEIVAKTVTSDSGKPEQNPVLFFDPDNERHVFLFYCRPNPKSGGYFQPATSILMYCESRDQGVTWSASSPLDIRNYKHTKGLWLRGPLYVTVDGLWLLPAYSERRGRSLPVSLVSDDSGCTWHGSEFMKGECRVQPTYFRAKHSSNIVALYRSRKGDFVYTAKSSNENELGVRVDRGELFREFQPTTLPNNNSGIALVDTYRDNRIIVAYNPTQFCNYAVPVTHTIGPRGGIKVDKEQRKWKMAQRFPMCVTYTDDDGETWAPPKIVHSNGRVPEKPTYCVKTMCVPGIPEYSYPSLAMTDNRTIHLTFTLGRECIAHVAFTEEWLYGEEDTVCNGLAPKPEEQLAADSPQ